MKISGWDTGYGESENFLEFLCFPKQTSRGSNSKVTQWKASEKTAKDQMGDSKKILRSKNILGRNSQYGLW